MNAITEWAARPATEMFLRGILHDSDFSAIMSVRFFEEQNHSVSVEYLRRFRPEASKGQSLFARLELFDWVCAWQTTAGL